MKIRSALLMLLEVKEDFSCLAPGVYVSCSVVSDSSQPHRPQPSRLLCPWNSPGKNTGVDCCSLLRDVFPTQGSNPGLLHSVKNPGRFFTVWATREAIRVVSSAIWGCWYFSWKSWFQLVIYPAKHFTWCTWHMSYISSVTIYSLDVLFFQFWNSPLFHVQF